MHVSKARLGEAWGAEGYGKVKVRATGHVRGDTSVPLDMRESRRDPGLCEQCLSWRQAFQPDRSWARFARPGVSKLCQGLLVGRGSQRCEDSHGASRWRREGSRGGILRIAPWFACARAPTRGGPLRCTSRVLRARARVRSWYCLVARCWRHTLGTVLVGCVAAYVGPWGRLPPLCARGVGAHMLELGTCAGITRVVPAHVRVCTVP